MPAFESEPGLGVAPDPDDPASVRAWFDRVYAARGLSYLRPPEAYPVFLEILGARRGEKLLDVACGPGLLLAAARRDGIQSHGIDFSRAAIGMARSLAPRCHPLVGDAQRLPYGSGKFDCLTCTGALERIPDRGAALAEMRRVVRPGGRLCVMVRNSRTLGWKIGIEALGRANRAGHQDADTLENWSELFCDLGFEIREILPDQWFWQRLRRKLGVSWEKQRHRIARPPLPRRFANELIFLLGVPE